MARKREKKQNDPKLQNKNGLSRRDFVKTGAVAGLGQPRCSSRVGHRRRAPRRVPKAWSGTMKWMSLSPVAVVQA